MQRFWLLTSGLFFLAFGASYALSIVKAGSILLRGFESFALSR